MSYHDFVIPSRMEQIPQVKQKIRSLLHHFEDDEIVEILLSFEEAVSNAIKHGNRYHPDKSVFISLMVTRDHISITVEDEGAGFNPFTLPDPTSPEGLHSLSGRGVFLLRHYMDSEYNDRGNKVVMKRERGSR